MARRSLSDIMASAPDIDRAKLDATTDEDIRRYKRADGFDPDARPAGLALAVPTAGELRARLDLSQEDFAAFLRVPVGTVRNWEQGRTLPDPAARTLIALVAADPEHATRILGKPVTGSPEGQRRARRFA
jgi:putative transcriptional regulator